VQDNWQVHPRLTIDLGLRLDHDSLSADVANVAPRIGFVFAPTRDNRTAIRGGFGVFFDKIPMNVAIFTKFPAQTITNYAADGRLQDGFGFIPNVAGAIANSPVLMKTFAAVFANVHSGSFAEDEIQIVLLTDAVANASAWAVAFHSALALKNQVSDEDVRAIRESRLPSAPKHAALSGLARQLIEKRGHVSAAELQTFLNAGFKHEHILEILTILAASTITNYAANIANPPLEPQFKEHAWNPKA
jgi:alkylhydroperoxidase family enzyme